MEAAWHTGVLFLNDTWRNYFYLVGLREENQKLQKELTLLQTKILDYDHQVNEVKRLRKLLNFATPLGKQIVLAEIVGIVGHPPFQSIRVEKGADAGVRIGMPVVSSKGVVGRVLRVNAKFSDIQRLGDSNFNLDVFIERNRIRGILKGIDNNRCLLQLHRRADVRIGDTIVSSGISGGFPQGLPVGVVVRISYEMDNVAQVVTIKPWVETQSLDEVMILQQTSDEVETLVETVGKEWLDNITKMDE
ncbi:MAG: rod shape-determining protein MreC [Deltaproteobacteria bacterium]|nr:rod shape-determining protein MreC [Deltaproteobacteria bacterium]